MNEIKIWLEEGDQIILAGDWNENVLAVQKKHLEQLGIREVLLEKYGSAPATYDRGSNPIDGIFMPTTLNIKQGGYLSFGEGIISDHCALWVDITYRNAFGHNMPLIMQSTARRLNCKDPKVMQRFLSNYEIYVSLHKLNSKAQEIRDRITFPMDPADKKKP